MKKMKVRLSGIAPLIMNNGQVVDPAHPLTIQKKPLSKKRDKTEADFEKISEIEFKGSLYMAIDDNGILRPVLPKNNLLATLIKGAAKSKKGKDVKAGAFIENDAFLEYDGPTDPDKLFKDGGFTLRLPVKIQKNKVMKTRAIFFKWSAVVEISVNEDILNVSDVFTFWEHAGLTNGICDWRPQHGRFEVELIKE